MTTPASPPTPPISSAPASRRTNNSSLDLTIQALTIQYLQPRTPGTADPDSVAGELTEIANQAARLLEAKPLKIRNPTLAQIAAAMIALHYVVRINEGGATSDRSQVAIYMTIGDKLGTYSTDEGELRRLIRRYSPNITRNQSQDLLQILLDQAPQVQVCNDRDVIAVNNGVFNYKTKELSNFTPDVVLLSKSPVDYVENPTSPTITHPEDGSTWELDEWVREVATVPDPDGGPSMVDEEIVDTLWKIAGAVNRPLVNWNKAAFLYSTTGNNGKGTYAHFLRGLTGPAATSIPLADMGKEFHLEGLSNFSAIICDENNVGVYLDQVGNLKALITQDVLLVNRKNKIPVAMRWRGLIVQCLNGLPVSKDKSQSFYRRQLFVPFRNRFEGGSIERKYIKFDYLQRKEVLEFALHKTLHLPDYYELQTPTAGQHVMNEYQIANDNTREFWYEIASELAWDIVPNAFLHDLYRAWMGRANPSSHPLGRNNFLAGLREVINESTEWRSPMDAATGQPQLLRVGLAMDSPEKLIDEYDLTKWMAPGYTGNNWQHRCVPAMPDRTRGIVRRSSLAHTPPKSSIPRS